MPYQKVAARFYRADFTSEVGTVLLARAVHRYIYHCSYHCLVGVTAEARTRGMQQAASRDATLMAIDAGILMAECLFFPTVALLNNETGTERQHLVVLTAACYVSGTRTVVSLCRDGAKTRWRLQWMY